jgi:putative phosphoribosyl transferase
MTVTQGSRQGECLIEIPAGRRRLPGILSVPREASGLVLFAHGSGSGRLSPRNQHVARILQRAGLATLLFDLLEENEADDRTNVFDIDLLAVRLLAAEEWLRHEHQELDALCLGLFGASTGAAAALVAAAKRPDRIGAVVSRGGRPDLAAAALSLVKAPTLLLIGGQDDAVLELNEAAFVVLTCPKDLVVIAGATHLFPEPGALDEVARLAAEWFTRYLARDAPTTRTATPTKGGA